MTNEELLEKIGEFIQPLVNGVAHLKTAVEALKAGQDDLREQVKDLREDVGGLQAGQKAIRAELATKADKADIKRLEQKIDETAKDHEERIEQLELAHHKN